MHPIKLLLGGLLTAGLVAAPISTASAGWHHHGGGFRGGFHGGLFGFPGALLAGAAALATAPIAIMAGAGSRGERGYDDGGGQYGYNAPPRGYAQQPQSYSSSRYYGGQPRYDYDQPPRGYYPPQQAMNDPRGGYYGGPPQGGYYQDPRGYYPPPQYYPSRDYSGPPQGTYGPPSRYYDSPSGY